MIKTVRTQILNLIVMSRLEKQGEEILRKIELMEKQFENEKMARLRESTEHDTQL